MSCCITFPVAIKSAVAIVTKFVKETCPQLLLLLVRSVIINFENIKSDLCPLRFKILNRLP